MTTPPSQWHPDAPTRLGLQAIHTADRQIAAYELLYRAGGANSASVPNQANLVGDSEHDRATAQVLGATFGEFGVEELSGGRLLFLNATRSFFTGKLPLPVPPGNMVLELLENIDVDRCVLAGMLELKSRGFAVAVDDFAGEISRVPALMHADSIKIDVEAVGDRLEQVLGLARKVNPSAAVVVERVETQEQFQACCDLGVDLFQGYLLHRPEVLQRQTLAPSHLTCVQLIAMLSAHDSEVDKIVDLLSTDPGLSLRVLKTVSSAAHAPKSGITSLRQAVVMIGRRELRDWVTLVLLAGAGSIRVPADTMTWIFARAEACRLSYPPAPDAAFTVGLISAAAEALGFDLVELTRGCVLESSVRAALLRGDGPIGRVLTAARAHDNFLLPKRGGSAWVDTHCVGLQASPNVYLQAHVAGRERAAALCSGGPEVVVQ